MTTAYCVVAGGSSHSAREDCYPFQGLGITFRGDAGNASRQASAVYTAAGNIIFVNIAVNATRLVINADNATTVAETYADIIPPTRSFAPSSGSGGASRPDRKYIFSLLTGTNDGCTDGVDVPFFVSEVLTFCAARKAAGFDAVILGTVLPAAISPTEPNRLAYNSTLTAPGWAAANNIDGIFDLGGDAIMGDPATLSDPAYYDTGHPTVLGSSILAPIWKATLDAVIATL